MPRDSESGAPNSRLSVGLPRAPLLLTKLNRPRVSADLIIRPRLLKLLDRAIDWPLTLVSAPAGYGKSVLASQWAEHHEKNVAWLSLDQNDSELRLFLDYLLAAIDSVVPGACPSTTELNQAPRSLAPEVISGYLVSELNDIETPIVLILDDYHLLSLDSPVHDLMTSVLRNSPRSLRVVILTRFDPPLPVGLLWADHHSSQVRIRDLRFSLKETAEYLEKMAGLTVSEQVLENLDRRLEGWVVGLRLLSIRLSQVEDPTALLQTFKGRVPYMRKYLVEEVLMDLPPEVLRPLLWSSILSRFCAPLLEAVCAAESSSVPAGFSGSEFIDLLRRESHFTISLDLPGEWFRYHHLFREVLTAELNRKYELCEIARLHERACTWFETEGLIEEAIRHALAAGNPDRAAEIISRHRISTLERHGSFVVERWLDMLPKETREKRMDLLAARLYALTSQYRLQEISWILQKVDSLPAVGAVDEALVAEIDTYRGLIQLLLSGDGNAAKRHLESALASRALKSELLKSRLDFFLALSRLVIGEGDQAIRFLEEQIRSLHEPGVPALARSTVFLAIVRLQSGDLSGASLDAGRVIDRLTECAPIIMAWARYVRANAQFQTFHLRDAAMDFAAVTLKWRLANLRVAVDAFGALALADHFLLRRDEVDSRLEELFKVAQEIGGTHSLNLAESFSARLALLQGRVKSALRWADANDGELVPSDTFMFLEVPLVTQSRVWVETGSTRTLARALPQLQSLLERFEGLHLTAHMVDVLALQAVAFSKQGQTEEASAALNKALFLAFQRGFVRPFIEAGSTMAALLDQFDGDPNYADFISTLRTAFGSFVDSSVAQPATTRPVAQMPAAVQPLVETLTNRELDVLELLAQRLQNKEIADRLSISPNTVKDHLKNIYGKLGVRGRREAVRRAISFGLPSTHP